MLPSADKLYKDDNFILQQDLAPAHNTTSSSTRFNAHGIAVLDWPTNLPELNPKENLWLLSRGR